MHQVAGGDLLALSDFLQVVHHVPGRLRVRVSKAVLRHASGLSLADIRKMIDKIEGVRSLKVSPATLSAVIEYDHHVIAPPLWHSLIDGPEDSARQAYTALTGHLVPVQEQDNHG